MDEKRMTPLAFNGLPTWAMAVSLASHLVAGILLGILYFRGVRWSADRLAGGDRTATTIAFTIGRFVFLGGLLTCASLEGALPLLTMALGTLAGRFAVLRHARAGAP
jgi:hypothetical protein